jgi:hypothetical protein
MYEVRQMVLALEVFVTGTGECIIADEERLLHLRDEAARCQDGITNTLNGLRSEVAGQVVEGVQAVTETARAHHQEEQAAAEQERG